MEIRCTRLIERSVIGRQRALAVPWKSALNITGSEAARLIGSTAHTHLHYLAIAKANAEILREASIGPYLKGAYKRTLQVNWAGSREQNIGHMQSKGKEEPWMFGQFGVSAFGHGPILDVLWALWNKCSNFLAQKPKD